MITKRNLLRLLERERERHATIEARLVDQLLHVTGNTWTLPPREEPDTPVVADAVEWTPSPEQFN